MVRLAANLTLMFNEVDFMDRFGAAAAAGFKGVEYLFPYDYPADDIAEQLEKHGLEQVLFDFPAGDWDGGDRGLACIPDRVGEFQDSVWQALEYAKTLNCTRLTCLAGLTPDGVDPSKVEETMVDNLKFAANAASGTGVTVLVEPLNTRGRCRHLRLHVGPRQVAGRGGRFSDSQVAVRHLPHADHGRRPSAHYRRQHGRHPPLPVGRQPGPQRTGHRRNQLRLPAAPHRRPGLRGLDRLRVPSGGQNRRRPRLGQQVHVEARPPLLVTLSANHSYGRLLWAPKAGRGTTTPRLAGLRSGTHGGARAGARQLA